jgi:hypothetical protein
MSKLLGIVGASGSGKSASLRNLPPEETFIISPSKSDLPIPGFAKNYQKANKEGTGNFYMTKDLKQMAAIAKLVATEEKYKRIKYLVIEDVTHFFNATTLSPAFRGQNTGNAAWSRWGDFGAEVYQALFGSDDYREDLWIITMFHPESYMTKEGEKLKVRTPGNLLDREVDIPSYYTTFLYTKVEPVDKNDPQPASERYKFVTNDDGYAPAKSLMGAFDDVYIENDLYAVITRLEEMSVQ